METDKGGWWKRLQGFMKTHISLTVIIVAVLLVELLSAAQYYYTHNLMEDELEKLARMELTTKAIIVKGIIETSEQTMKSHIMEIKRNLANPDSMSGIMAWTLKFSPQMKGCGIAFDPRYYKDKDALFEPYALRTDSGIQHLQVAGERFDYTKHGFYKYIQEKKANSWVGPYDDVFLQTRLISYAVPIYDFAKDTVAVFGVDIDVHSLSDTLNYGHIYPSSFELLLTEDGELIAGPNEPRLQKVVDGVIRAINDSTVSKSWSKKGSARTFELYDEDAGDELSVFFARIKEKPHWQVAVVCYDDEVYGALSNLRIRLFLFSLLAFGILLYIVGRFARNEEMLRQKTLEEERIESELRVASKIQQNMLPQEEVRDDRIEVRGSLVPAKEVGGDLYDYFIRDEKLFFCIGDVSGKGAASAMMMAVAQTKFRDFSAHENNPARIMQNINTGCCKNNKTNMFVTMFIGVLDLPTGRLRYCDAGHDAPFIICNPQSSIFNLQCNPNLPVGVFDDFAYAMQETQIAPESTLFLYTDGLTEAKNAKHEQFGLERVKEVLADCLPNDLIVMVTDAVHEFVKEAKQSDDLTMLAIRYTPKQFESILSETLVIKNDVREVSRFSDFMKAVTEKLNIEKSLARQLRLAVEEAVVNVIDYAYPAGQEGEIEVRMMSDGMSLKTLIIDSGVAFDPTTKEKADTSLSAEDRQIGGLGLLLVRELMDSVNYERINKQNILTLTKKYN